LPWTETPDKHVCPRHARLRLPNFFLAFKEHSKPMRTVWPFKNRVKNPPPLPLPRALASTAAQPDFLCIGAQKAGTTWLYQHLHLHPDFWMPPRKELHYFDQRGRAGCLGRPRKEDERDFHFLEALNRLSDQPFIDLDGYAQLFEVKGSLISGDITPAYSTLEDEIIARITRRFPKLKVIFLARDPVERALSQLSMDVRFKLTDPFDLCDPDEVIRKLLHPAVLSRSYPSKIVARWRCHVHADQFRIYFFEELEKTPAALFSSIVGFLGGDPEKNKARFNWKAKVNSAVKLPFSHQVESRVAQFFKPELQACAAELGGPASKWPQRYGLSLLIFSLSIFENTLDLLVNFDWAI
jgi:hypothetical protein